MYDKRLLLQDIITTCGTQNKVSDTISVLPTISMVKNNKHALVTPLERYMKELGYYTGTIEADEGKTPTFGSGMKKAIMKFQIEVVGYAADTADGVLSATGKTWKVLLDLINNTGNKGKVSKTKAAIREEALNNSEYVVTLYKNDPIDILVDHNTNYYIVGYNDTSLGYLVGYFKKSCAAILEVVEEPEPEEPSGEANEVILTPEHSLDVIVATVKAGGNIKFTTGTYSVNKTIVVPSSTNVICETGVIFKQVGQVAILQTAVTRNTTAYNGASKINWKGGTFVGNDSNLPKNLVNIVHANGVTVEGTIFIGAVYHHFIEINSSKDVTINNCIFKNPIVDPDKVYKEAIQLDFAYSVGLSYDDSEPNSPCYDGTHCSNIVIINNEFINVRDGIGTHTQSYCEAGTTVKYHDGIEIANNTARCRSTDADTCRFVKLLNMRNVHIHDNTTNDFGIFTQIYSNNKAWKNNSTPSVGNKASDARCENVTIENNTMYCSSYNDSVAIKIYSKNNTYHQNITLTGNVVKTNTQGQTPKYVMQINDVINLSIMEASL